MIAKMLRGPKAQAGVVGVGDDGATEGGAGHRPWVLHPFLIAIFPIASLYSHNVYETPLGALAVPIVVALGSTFVLWMVFRLLSGDPSKAGLATSLLVASFFGFGAFSRWIDSIRLTINYYWVFSASRMNPITALAWLALVVGIGLVWIFWRLGKTTKWTRYLNAFTFILAALPIVGAASARLSAPAAKPIGMATPASSTRGWTPDIYFIILDGYARSDVMKALFDFDNEPFLSRLERKGFFVDRQSQSNYCQTRLSLASTLNADYLDKLVDTSNRDLLPLSGLIKDNLVFRMLKPLGYKYVSYATGFEPTEHYEADFFLCPSPPRPEFTQILLEMTPLGAPYSVAIPKDRYTDRRERTLFLLEDLPKIAERKEPTFTFAHIISPHPPFVFGENGEDVSPRRFISLTEPNHPLGESFGTAQYFREAYRKQSAFLTARVEQTIEKILAASPEPPVIILQSDHGSWLRYHPDDVEQTDLNERFGILNCIYVPNRKVEGLHDRMTSVNTFRVLLKEIIGADLPPLKDRNYFSNYHDALKFVDVTERLHSEKERTRIFRSPDEFQGLEQQF